MEIIGGMNIKMDYSRQHEIYNPNEQKLKIQIVGAGSTGSFIALNLAKLGFKNISVIDFDKVEKHNIPNQFYRMKDINKPKVEALKEIIKDFTGTEISIINKKVDEYFEFDLDLNTLIVFCVDNMKSRKLIYEKVKEFPIKLIDTRMGGSGYQIYTLDLSEEENKTEFENRLNQNIKNAPCGQKAVIYTTLSVASEVTNLIKKIDKEEDYPRIIKREMINYKIIQNGRTKI